MFEKASMLYLYVETSLHPGTGSSVDVVDLPIQRERVTKYPMIQGSGVKGKLRAEANARNASPDSISAVFGSESHEYAGALSPGDARLLLFPMRSLTGFFAWTTSRFALERFRRDLLTSGQAVSWTTEKLVEHEKTAWTVNMKSIVANNKVVLDEFAFSASVHEDVGTIASWIAEHVFPQAPEYEFFRNRVKTNLVVLPEDAFRDFLQFGTEIITRVRIEQETKTVADGALWTEEHVPSDTVFYVPLHASRPRLNPSPKDLTTADDVLAFPGLLGLTHLQLGGDETVGKGIVRVRFGNVAAAAGRLSGGGTQ